MHMGLVARKKLVPPLPGHLELSGMSMSSCPCMRQARARAASLPSKPCITQRRPIRYIGVWVHNFYWDASSRQTGVGVHQGSEAVHTPLLPPPPLPSPKHQAACGTDLAFLPPCLRNAALSSVVQASRTMQSHGSIGSLPAHRTAGAVAPATARPRQCSHTQRAPLKVCGSLPRAAALP